MMKSLNPMEYSPPLPVSRPKKKMGRFVQTITLREGQTVVAQAIWVSENEGVVQLLHLQVDSNRGRQGYGGRMLDEVVRQAAAYQRLIDVPLRRIWMMVEQKSQVIGRAFLTSQGFHHVGTMNGLYKDQDALMYMRTFN
jgi:ribosomal protein S18 acetylase RimI-like enzyme